MRDANSGRDAAQLSGRMTAVREATLVLAVSAVLSLSGSATIPFYTRGEPREGLVAREMLATGEWLVPARPDGELARKPPLYYWAAAPALRALPARPELALRLPSAIGAIVATLATWAVTRATVSRAAALPAALVLATGFEWMRAATAARVDMALAAPLTLAFAGLAYGVARGGTAVPGVLLAAGVALATLGKGPVGVVLPALAAGAVALARRDVRGTLRIAAPGLTAGAALAGAWYAIAYLQAGSPFLDTVVRENWLRFVDPDAKTGHVHAPGYLLALGLVGILPWTPLLPLAIAGVRARSALALPAAWAATGFVFFSLAAAKRSVYLLPLEPALAVLIGAAVAAPRADGTLARVARAASALYVPALLVLAALGIALAAGIDVAAPVRPWLRADDALAAARLARAGRDAAPALWLLAAVTLVAVPAVARARRAGAWRRLVGVVAGLTVAWTVAFQVLVHPALARARSLRPFFARVDRVLPDDAVLYAFYPPDPGLRFYAPRTLRRWPPGVAGPGPVHLLVWEDEWRRLRDARHQPLAPLAVSRAREPGRGHLLLVAVPPGPLVPTPERRGPKREPESEGIVDAGEDRGALASAADVDEAHDLRPHHAAEADPVHPVEVVDG